MRAKLIDLVKKWSDQARNSSRSDDERGVYYACAEELHSLCGTIVEKAPEAECWECAHENDSFSCQECIHDPAGNNQAKDSRFESRILFNYVKDLIRLNVLNSTDEGNLSQEADEIRERLEDIERKHRLPKEDRAWIEDLSGDLYQLYDKSMYRAIFDEEKESLREELQGALIREDRLKVLEIIRNGLGLPEAQVAFYRGWAWQQKNTEVANLFLDYARKLDPSIWDKKYL